MSQTASHIDRIEAARLLQTARRGGWHSPEAADAIDWAFVAMPESRTARRLKIDQLLHHGDFNAADALITQGLTAHPGDPALSLLRARRLFDTGRLPAAARELKRALVRRPHHSATLALAGTVDRLLGNWHAAARLLRRSLVNCNAGNRQAISRELFLSLFDGRAVDEAQAVLDQMPLAPPDLTAKLLCALRRPLEAAEILKHALRDRPDPARSQALLCQLIDLLEEIGDRKQLASLLETITIDHPQALRCAGQAWLSLGLFRRSIGAMRALSHNQPHRRAALTILLVAAALAERSRLAHRALRQLQLTLEGIDVQIMADAWRRGLLGRIVTEQQRSGGAGADPSSSQLLVFLNNAVRVFDVELDSATATSGPERVELRRFRSLCLSAMGGGMPGSTWESHAFEAFQQAGQGLRQAA